MLSALTIPALVFASNLKARRAAPPTSNSLPYAFSQSAFRNLYYLRSWITYIKCRISELFLRIFILA
jgi:hypothetical protein